MRRALSLATVVVLSGCYGAVRHRGEPDGGEADGDLVGDADRDAFPDPDAAPIRDAGGGGPTGCVAGRSETCACTDGRLGAQSCEPDGTWGPCVCAGDLPTDGLAAELARVTTGMVGTWHGTVWTPWIGTYEVDVTFEADGHYSASCTGDPDCSPFYWGLPGESELKRWQTVGIYATFEVFGAIDLVFFDDTVTHDILDRITLSTDGTELTLEVWRYDRDHGGPPFVSLVRVG